MLQITLLIFSESSKTSGKKGGKKNTEEEDNDESEDDTDDDDNDDDIVIIEPGTFSRNIERGTASSLTMFLARPQENATTGCIVYYLAQLSNTMM